MVPFRRKYELWGRILELQHVNMISPCEVSLLLPHPPTVWTRTGPKGSGLGPGAPGPDPGAPALQPRKAWTCIRSFQIRGRTLGGILNPLRVGHRYFGGSGRPRGPQRPFQKLGGFAPNLWKGFRSPWGRPDLQNDQFPIFENCKFL